MRLCPGVSGEGAGTPPLTVCGPVTLGPAEMGGFQEVVWQCSTLSVSAGAGLSSSIGSDPSLEVGQAAACAAGLPPGHAWRVWLWFWLLRVSSSWSVSSDGALSASRLSPPRRDAGPQGERRDAASFLFLHQLKNHEVIPYSKKTSGLGAALGPALLLCFAVTEPSSLLSPTPLTPPWSSPWPEPRAQCPTSCSGPNHLLAQNQVPVLKWSWGQLLLLVVP